MKIFFVVIVLLVFLYGCSDDRMNLTEVLPDVMETSPQTNVTYLTFRKGSQPSPNIHGLAPKNDYLEWSDTRFQIWANGDNTTINGTPLEIGGVIFKRGISAHAYSRIVYSLENRYDRFEAWVGLPNSGYRDGDHIPCGHGGSVQFFFKIDGIIVHNTGEVNSIDLEALTRGEVVNVPPLYVTFDILSTASVLEIEVTDAGDGLCADGWIIADAKLISDDPIELTEGLPDIIETSPQTPDIIETSPQTPDIIETSPQTNVTYLTFRKGSQPSPNIHGLAPKNDYLEWSDTRFQIWANGDNTTINGTPLEIGGVIFKRGISAHAYSRIVYSLENRYDRFEAWVGLPNSGYRDGDHIPCGHGGSVQFFFKIDGIIVHNTGEVNSIDLEALTRGEVVNVPPLYVTFDIPSTASVLEIEVTDAGDGLCADGWIIADAKLISDN